LTTITADTLGALKSERILITGITGIHGWPLFSALAEVMPQSQLFGIGPPRMKKPFGSNVAAFCVADKEALCTVKNRFSPTVVIHAAGVCDLDVCEERPHWAERLNRHGTALVAEVFGSESVLYFLSTDLVFSGDNPPFGGYTERCIPDPVSIAGKTFLSGEEELVARACEWAILRLGLPVGGSVNGDKGGLDWVEGRFKKGRQVTLFSDEYRSMIPCSEIARCVIECIAAKVRGVFHLGGPEAVSLHGLGKKIIEGGGYNPLLLTSILRSEEVNGPPRIGNVALNSEKIMRYLSAAPGGWRY